MGACDLFEHCLLKCGKYYRNRSSMRTLDLVNLNHNGPWLVLYSFIRVSLSRRFLSIFLFSFQLLRSSGSFTSLISHLSWSGRVDYRWAYNKVRTISISATIPSTDLSTWWRWAVGCPAVRELVGTGVCWLRGSVQRVYPTDTVRYGRSAAEKRRDYSASNQGLHRAARIFHLLAFEKEDEQSLLLAYAGAVPDSNSMNPGPNVHHQMLSVSKLWDASSVSSSGLITQYDSK